MDSTSCTYIVGFVYATLGGGLIWLVTDGIWRRIKGSAPSDPLFAFMIGVVERPLYLAALLMGHEIFVGGWLGLKFAGWWTSREQLKATAAEKLPRWFNSFLIGNGLSIAYAGVGYLIVRYGTTRTMEATFAAVGLVIVTAGLAWLTRWVKKVPESGGG